MSKARELEAQLERSEKQLRLFQKISRYLAKNTPLREALDAIAGHVADFMRADSCLMYLLSHGELVLCAARGANPAAVGEVRLRLDEGLTGWVARERRLLAISREAYSDPRFKNFRNLPEDTYEAFLSAPVIVRNRVAGVINLQHKAPHAHTGEELEMITTVGEQVGALVMLAQAQESAVADIADLVLGARVGS